MNDFPRPAQMNYAKSWKSPDSGAFLHAINNSCPSMETMQEHIVELPVLCPYSKNPAPGSNLIISYKANACFLEVFSLFDYVRSFISHPIVRDVELLTQTIARDCAMLLEVDSTVTGRYILNGLNQTVITRVVHPGRRPGG